MLLPSDYAKQINEAPESGGGNRVGPTIAGEGTVTKFFALKARNNVMTVIAELQVDKCLPEMGVVDEKGNPKSAGNAVGSTFGLVFQLSGPQSEVGASNLKRFILPLDGETSENLKAQGKDFFALVNQYLDESNPSRGMRVKYSTYEAVSKKSGKKLTIPKFEHVPQTGEQIAKRRAELDATEGAEE